MEKPNCGFRRSREQVLVDILKLCKIPQPKTHILNNTNTNFKLLQGYLLEMQAAQLIERHEENKKYSTTEKGRSFIKTWAKLQQMINTQQPASLKHRKYARNKRQMFVVTSQQDIYA